jgi:radical SAM protein with 4Fe4S-binding SPASM domain
MNKNTFCILPFINTTIERSGDYMICPASMSYSSCNVNTHNIDEAWNSDFNKEVRQSLINGVRHNNCKTCWYHEDKGVESRREKSNRAWLEQYKDRVNESGIVEQLPNQLSIKVDNTCNLKCITCNHYHSNQIEKELEAFEKEGIDKPKWFKIIDSFKGDQVNTEKPKLTENLSKILKNSSYLEIEGGEPLSHPMLIKILDHCIENDQCDITIQITTNLTSLSNQLIERLAKFKNIMLGVSWDHITAEKFRYIRYPADYERFLSNFYRLTTELPHIQIDISLTVSIFNIFDVPSILDHFEQLKRDGRITGRIIYRNVFQPDYFSITYLNENQKQQIKYMLEEYLDTRKDFLILEDYDLVTMLRDVKEVLNTPQDFSDVVAERSRLIVAYDKVRKTDTYSLFPFLKDE